jgi:predicted RNA methylase
MNKQFPKVKKKFALNNSYFKNRLPDMPENPFEVLDYLLQHNELPYTDKYGNPNEWFYDCFVEYQKRAGVQNSQFFTPTATAERIAHTVHTYANFCEDVLEPCCGFGQITQQLFELGFENVSAFDNDEKMVSAAQKLTIRKDEVDCFEVYDYTSDDHIHLARKYPFIVSNPPYGNKELTDFLEYVREKLDCKGIAVLLLPLGFLDKMRHSRLVQILNDFSILEREPMEEPFARTGTRAEIVVLEKIS